MEVGLPVTGHHAINYQFVADFESGEMQGILDQGWSREMCCSHSGNFVTSPVRSGGRAFRFELNHTDPLVSNSYRTEIRAYQESAKDPIGSERWYGLSIYLPAGYDDDDTIEVVGQWHATPDQNLGEPWRGPPVALVTVDHQWRIANTWDAAQVTEDWQNPTQGGNETLWTGAYQTGRWTDWVFHIKWSYQADGVLEVWRDGSRVVNKQGPNCYNDERGIFPKFGIYKAIWKRTDITFPVDQRVLFYDEIRIGQEDATYADVAPGSAPATDAGQAPADRGPTDRATGPDRTNGADLTPQGLPIELDGVRLTHYAGTAPGWVGLTHAVVGARYHTDRAYVLESLPQRLVGGVLVQWANDDKPFTGADFLRLVAERGGTAYVAYDSRATILPTFLDGWSATGEMIQGFEAGRSEQTQDFDLRERTMSAGTPLTLGGNSQGGADGQTGYVIVVVPATPVVDAGQDAVVVTLDAMTRDTLAAWDASTGTDRKTGPDTVASTDATPEDGDHPDRRGQDAPALDASSLLEPDDTGCACRAQTGQATGLWLSLVALLRRRHAWKPTSRAAPLRWPGSASQGASGLLKSVSKYQ